MTAKLDAIGLVVADLKVSIAFYQRLGLDFGNQADAEGHGHAEAVLGGGMRVMLDSIEGMHEFDPGYRQESGDPRAALAFLCSSPAAVNELYAELVGAGASAHKEPWDAFWGQRYAQLRDPDGNGVDLFAPL
jgi:catechol 2,3-dioxygenase-like lactoylglutathione lyase family enzyme